MMSGHELAFDPFQAHYSYPDRSKTHIAFLQHGNIQAMTGCFWNKIKLLVSLEQRKRHAYIIQDPPAFSPNSSTIDLTPLPSSMRASLARLQPSPRVYEYLLRTGRIKPPSMALINIEQPLPEPPPPLKEPPAVAITPLSGMSGP